MQLEIVVLLSLSKRTTYRKMKRKLKLYLVQRDIGNERVCWLGSDMMAMAFRNVRKLMMLVTISIARESLQDSSRRFSVSVVLVGT